MASRIGRNPFQSGGQVSKKLVAEELQAMAQGEPKDRSHEQSARRESPTEAPQPMQSKSPLAWALIDFRADAFVFGLKAYLYAHAVLTA
jgi:hypothetical protein